MSVGFSLRTGGEDFSAGEDSVGGASATSLTLRK